MTVFVICNIHHNATYFYYMRTLLALAVQKKKKLIYMNKMSILFKNTDLQHSKRLEYD